MNALQADSFNKALSSSPGAQDQKKTYLAPALRSFGKLRDLTLSGGSSTTDTGSELQTPL